MQTVTIKTSKRFFLLVGLAALSISQPLYAQPAQVPTGAAFFVMASTTSTEQSGLFAHLLPLFTARTGIQVRVVALGTGQAIAVASRGDADLLFVHDQAAEEKFVNDGHGLARWDVMYNDFVIVGPRGDPAAVAGLRDAGAAFRKIALGRQPFFSRGDRSGTHAAELRFWELVGVEPKTGAGGWYRETGSGMGPTLNVASAANGYVLADRGTWLNFRNRGDLTVLVEGDVRLFNQYGVIVVNPARHPHARAAQAKVFAEWVVSDEGQRRIADYKIGGEQLFFPNAKR